MSKQRGKKAKAIVAIEREKWQKRGGEVNKKIDID